MTRISQIRARTVRVRIELPTGPGLGVGFAPGALERYALEPWS